MLCFLLIFVLENNNENDATLFLFFNCPKIRKILRGYRHLLLLDLQVFRYISKKLLTLSSTRDRAALLLF